jgi:hypothetical protein
LVEKKEGATMMCKQCGTDLICRLKDYGGNYAPALQWQNHDGNAHYKTVDGKNFSCNIPEDKIEGQQTFTPPARIAGTSPPLPPNPQFGEIIAKINEQTTLITRIFEMTEAIMHHTIDEQLRKKNETSN